jgi:hypothetical protein
MCHTPLKQRHSQVPVHSGACVVVVVVLVDGSQQIGFGPGSVEQPVRVTSPSVRPQYCGCQHWQPSWQLMQVGVHVFWAADQVHRQWPRQPFGAGVVVVVVVVVLAQQELTGDSVTVWGA